MNHDNIISLVFFKDDVLNINYFRRFNKDPLKWKNKYPNIKSYLKYRYDDSDSLLETLYRIHYNIEVRPVCKICGKKLEFGKSTKKQREKFVINKCFKTYCSFSCEMKDKDVMDKHNAACIKKYGSPNNTKKQQETCIKKYGVNTIFKDKEFRKKSKETCIKKYGSSNNIKKQQETVFEKYGVKSTLCINKCREKRKSKESLYKEYCTKKKNNSYNKSTIEDKSYELVKERFPETIRQYRSEEYPFNCDFYIPSINTYIEIQGSHYHHYHPFDINDINDIKELEKLKKLSDGTNQYSKIIYTWTDLDIRKRKIVKENNLNWFEFFNINELMKWLENYA